MVIVNGFPLTILSGGEDYNTSIDQILFTSGSIKDDRQCFNITIAEDLLDEGNETFFINAEVQAEDIPNRSGHVSGSGQETLSVAVNFGGALNSSTGSISVTIIDDDGKYAYLFLFSCFKFVFYNIIVCSIPSKYCEGKCRQRLNAGKNTFRDNGYTYGKLIFSLIIIMLFFHTVFAAAHIELLGIVRYDACTTVKAHIIQCWEIQENTCPPVNTSYIIPTCTSCPKLRPLNVSDHYLIAGIH